MCCCRGWPGNKRTHPLWTTARTVARAASAIISIYVALLLSSGAVAQSAAAARYYDGDAVALPTSSCGAFVVHQQHEAAFSTHTKTALLYRERLQRRWFRSKGPSPHGKPWKESCHCSRVVVGVDANPSLGAAAEDAATGSTDNFVPIPTPAAEAVGELRGTPSLYRQV